ncbi:MAG TPA: hypothetical protein VK784_13165 [Pseudonocardiaceae bacterium]|nr:hypothetical protein [Pseudonocardiaceae bacterium]
MTAPATPATDLLDALERRWRGALQEVSLVAEVGATPEDVRASLRALGSLYQQAWDPQAERDLLHRRFPACVVVALAGIGALDYVHGNYWTGVWQQAGVIPRQDDQAIWGRAFRNGLDRFRLARFEGLPQVNVGEIMVHAGVPVYCLADFLRLLLERQDLDSATNAAAILTWVTAPGHESRLASLDMPVRRFLQFGGDYAEDFLDRSLELLERLREPSFDADGVGLPTWIIDKARALTEDGALGLTGRQPRASRAAREQPRLIVDPFGGGLLLSLPPVPGARNGLAVWQVHVDGDTRTVHSQSRWSGAEETAPAVDVPLTAPANQALVRLTTTGQEWEIDLVNRDDPLLVFTEDGRHIPPKAALPPEPVWLLHPDVMELAGTDVEVRGEHTDLGAVPVPYGWAGWQLHRFGLGVGSAVRLGTAPWRSVQGARRARLESLVPVPGARTIDNEAVLSARPRLELPAERSVATAWSVRIRRPEVSTALVALDVIIDSDSSIDPWRGLVGPLVGPYELTVRGPLGRGLRRTVVIVEGLGTTAVPRWRELRWGGLSPAIVTATLGVAGLRLDPPVVRLGTDEATAQFTASGHDHGEVIRVTPPHMAVQRVGRGEYSQWSLRPLRLATESLNEGTLLVHLPAILQANLIVRSGNTDLQTVPSEFTGGQALARFDLGRIADTVRLRGSAQLDVQLETVRYPIARCEPLHLARAITVDEEGRLVLAGSPAIEGLMAGCYQIYAPWRKPEIVEVDSCLRTEPLARHLRFGGPLAVLLRICDPWLPSPWPPWPAREDTFLIAGGVWSADEPHSGETRLSGFLAGANNLVHDATTVPFAGLLYHRADAIGRYVKADVRRSSAAILSAHPRETLISVAKGELVGSDVVAPLIHAGLAALPVQAYVDPDHELRLWTISPLAAVLASAHALKANDADVLHEHVVTACGSVADDLLRGEDDPFARAGTFEGAERFATFPAAQMDIVWRAAAIVPRGLLSADERAAAARELFDNRWRLGVERVAREARVRLAELTQLIRRHSAPNALAAVQARGGREGWVALPALSLALALTARLAARDTGLRRCVAHFVATHAALARHAPRLVTVDLVLAELLLTGADA